ncbi:O-antigen chain-terminating methyltransferase [Paenibacillus algorifonticola]|uniref:O-antigen chain-terminating methyltransferase n=1 Tax=Paenibacillus algorifonticola TaxID=684063 RepID=A0A1I2E071_9BACL|nr:methionine biosynthesis protein MetW [Paenibacillus algorifonticola]SFE86245.1 O-antigen chain-terminating methyltransferase [Paenibacillus algorifonticola]
MTASFDSAEELMEHLKKQIIEFPNSEETITYSVEKKTGTGILDLTSFRNECDANNSLWNVSTDRPITSHRKLTGKFIVLGKKVVRKLLRWHVGNTFEMQTTFNGSVTRSFNELYNVVLQLTAKQEQYETHIQEQQKHIQRLENKLNNLDMQREVKIGMNNFKTEINEFKTEFDELKTEFDNLKTEKSIEKHKSEEDIANVISEVRSSQNNYVRSFNELTNLITDRFNTLDDKFKAEINFMQYRLRKIKNQSLTESSGKLPMLIEPNEKVETDSNSFDYLHFENKFRGSVDEIKKRQTVYLPYFINKENVLDIGCGRGEFIELMLENSVSVKGIDLNREMVEYCQDRGLPVEYNDAIQYLHSVEDNALGGIFLGQVIEHLTFEQIITLVELSYNKLKAGSYLIMETPNPLSLAIFYRTFYVDPTHVKPVHPLTIQYLVESIGFKEAKLNYSSRVEPNWWLPTLDVEEAAIKNVNEFNEGINRINELLYGNLDYAIIAKK